MSDEDRWLTYEELGQLIGRTPNGARMFATRRGWPKRSSNRIGERATVLVPTELDEAPPRALHDAEQTGAAVLANGTDERAAIDALTEQLAITNRRLETNGRAAHVLWNVQRPKSAMCGDGSTKNAPARPTPRPPSGSLATRPPGCAPNWTPASSGDCGGG